MSKLTELQKQYNGYKAALDAAESVKPGYYEAHYGESRYATVTYSPRNDYITVSDEADNTACILLKDIPGLMKALTELCGEPEGKE